MISLQPFKQVPSIEHILKHRFYYSRYFMHDACFNINKIYYVATGTYILK